MMNRLCFVTSIVLGALAGYGCDMSLGLDNLFGTGTGWGGNPPPYKIDISSINVDGTGLFRITSDGKSLHPRSSPDGARILFISGSYFFPRSIDSVTLNLINSDGAAREILATDARCEHASYSPDGVNIAYVTWSFGYQQDNLYVLSTASRIRTRLTGSGWITKPKFSCDGKRVYFLAGYELYSVDIDGTNLRSFASPVSDYDCSEEKVVVAQVTGAGVDIIVLSLEGTILRRLVHTDNSDASPRFSPDGTTVVFTRQEGYDDWIYRVGVDGSTPMKLTKGYQPSFSPDGSKLVYTNGGILYIMSSNGTENLKLFELNNSGGIEDPSFSPDGTRIIFTVYQW